MQHHVSKESSGTLCINLGLYELHYLLFYVNLLCCMNTSFGKKQNQMRGKFTSMSSLKNPVLKICTVIVFTWLQITYLRCPEQLLELCSSSYSHLGVCKGLRDFQWQLLSLVLILRSVWIWFSCSVMALSLLICLQFCEQLWTCNILIFTLESSHFSCRTAFRAGHCSTGAEGETARGLGYLIGQA